MQGVCYRATAQIKARQLGLTGWVQNRADASVEVYACGTPAALQALETWLWQGPPHAQVNHVESEASEYREFGDFSIRD